MCKAIRFRHKLYPTPKKIIPTAHCYVQVEIQIVSIELDRYEGGEDAKNDR